MCEDNDDRITLKYPYIIVNMRERCITNQTNFPCGAPPLRYITTIPRPLDLIMALVSR